MKKILGLSLMLCLAAACGDDDPSKGNNANNANNTNNSNNLNNENNQNNTNNENNGDLCDLVDCSTDATCNGDTLVTGTGSCDSDTGMCTTTETDCTANGQSCMNGACVDVEDLCAAVDCVADLAECDGTTARVSSGGACNAANGMCEFANVDETDCTATNQVCVDGGCVDPTPMAPAAGDLAVTEIMNDPAGVADGAGEWFELFNAAPYPVILNDVQVGDLDGNGDFRAGFTLTDPNAVDIILPVGGYYVLGNNADMNTNGGVQVDFEYSGFSLGNGDDAIVILDANGGEVDRVVYTAGAAWGDPTGATRQFDGARDATADDNADALNWCVANSMALPSGDFGTPGAVNPDCPLPVVYTITQIQDENGQNRPTEGTYVQVDDVIVTGVRPGGGFFAQDPNAATPEWSGIWVDFDEDATIVVGATVSIVGTYEEDQLGGSSLTSIVGRFVTVGVAGVVPTAVLLDSVVLQDAAIAEMYEGVLVTVNEAGVTDGDLGFGEFRIDASVNVDDLLFDYDADATIGDPQDCDYFNSITGPLNESFGAYKIEPRDAADMPGKLAAAQQLTVEVQLGVGSGYAPREICVNEDDVITFTNIDAAIGHTVHERDPTMMAPNNIGAAIIATLAGGTSAPTSFPDSGTQHYRCQPHANMEGVVIVLE